MALDPADFSALQKAQQAIAQVIADLQARPDYPARSELTRDAGRLDAYGQSLRNAMALETLSAPTCRALIDQGQNDALPVITARIDANIGLARMGPLNTARTITPERAQANNINLGTAQECVQSLNARLLADISQMTAPPDRTTTGTGSTGTGTTAPLPSPPPRMMTGNSMTNTGQTGSPVQTTNQTTGQPGMTGTTATPPETGSTPPLQTAPTQTTSGQATPVQIPAVQIPPAQISVRPLPPSEAEATARFSQWVRSLSGEVGDGF